MNPDPLAQLRDIHLPEAVGWWPMAPALWALLVAACVVITLSVWLLLRWHSNNRYRRLARRALQQHFVDYRQHQNQATLCQQVLSTLRRCLLSSNSSQLSALASLPSRQLLQSSGNELFSDNLVEQLEQCLYGPQPQLLDDVDIQQLQRSSKRWLGSIPRFKQGVCNG
ncbi:MAG: DUF4381 domain-containing protein [Porticoccaceae bacterium]|nr:DUF4381 domain-containing protein [Porticoccaceae bacterium]